MCETCIKIPSRMFSRPGHVGLMSWLQSWSWENHENNLAQMWYYWHKHHVSVAWVSHVLLQSDMVDACARAHIKNMAKVLERILRMWKMEILIWGVPCMWQCHDCCCTGGHFTNLLWSSHVQQFVLVILSVMWSSSSVKDAIVLFHVLKILKGRFTYFI